MKKEGETGERFRWSSGHYKAPVTFLIRSIETHPRYLNKDSSSRDASRHVVVFKHQSPAVSWSQCGCGVQGNTLH